MSTILIIYLGLGTVVPSVCGSICREGGLEKGWSLTQFYDVDGHLHEELFKAEIQKLVAQCEQQHKKSK